MDNLQPDQRPLNARVAQRHYFDNGLGYTLLTIIEDGVIHRPVLALLIEEHTAKQHIFDAWEKIKSLRKIIVGGIGSDLDINYDNVLLGLRRLQENGVGYGELAKILNYRCLALVCCAYFSNESWDDSNWGMGLTNLYFYFIGLRIREEDQKKHVEVAFDNLRNNIIPWKLVDGPFSRARIRNSVDSFRDRFNEGKIVIVPDSKVDDTDLIVDAYLLQNGWYEKANRYLQRDQVYWKRNQKWIGKLLEDIKQEIRDSKAPYLEEYRLWLENGGKIENLPHT